MTAGSKAAVKSGAVKDDPAKKRHHARKSGMYESYIHAVLTKQGSKNHISKPSLVVMNEIVEELFHRIAREAMKACVFSLPNT